MVAAPRSSTLPEGVEVLAHDLHVRFDPRGAATVRTTRRYRLLTAAAVAENETIQVSWAPWHQRRPRLEAVVTTPDRRRHRLDARTIADLSVATTISSVLSNRRVLRAPLPGLVVGAVVEDLREVVEVRPALEPGGLHRFSLVPAVPTRRVRVTLEAPARRPLRYALPGTRVTRPIVDEVRRGVRRIVIEAGPFLEPIEREPLTPFDVPSEPQLVVSSTRFWSEVAGAYGALVDRLIRRSDVAPTLRQALPGGGRERRVAAVRLTAWIREHLRYLALSLDAGAIIPRTPAEVLERRFGDCKDLSTLLVALLRRAGIPAHVALLKAGDDEDVHPDLPGIDEFNHVIVHVPGPEPLWIDPTARAVPVGELPLAAQGRRALIVRPGENQLVLTPTSEARHNTSRRVVDVRLAASGGARVTDRYAFTGALAALWRGRAQLLGGSLKAFGDHYARTFLGSQDVTRFTQDPAVAAGPGPFHMSLEVSNAERFTAEDHSARVELSLADVLASLPDLLREDDELEALAKRRHGVLVPMPYLAEVRYRVHRIPGYALESPPDARRLRLGPATLAVEVRTAVEPGVDEVTIRFEWPARTLSRDGLQQYRADVKALTAGSPMVTLEYVNVGYRAFQAGDWQRALAIFRGLEQRHPGEFAYTRQTIRALLDAGFGAEARRRAQEAVRANPREGLRHEVLAFVMGHDLYGGYSAPGWDREGTLAALRAARRLEPRHAGYRRALAFTLTRDEFGWLHRPGHDLREALAEYAALERDKALGRFVFDYARTLFFADRPAEVIALVRRHPSSKEAPAYLVAATARLHGIPRAVQALRDQAPTASGQKELAEAAADLLVNARQYREAAALLEQTVPASLKEAARRRRMARTRLQAPPARDFTTPEAFVRAALWAMRAPHTEGDAALGRMLHPEVPRAGAPVLAALRRHRFWLVMSLLEETDYPFAAIDGLLSTARLLVDGDGRGGYRVRVMTDAEIQVTFFLRPSGQELRLRALSNSATELGTTALSLMAAGHLVAARRWLDWAVALEKPAKDPWEGVAAVHLILPGRPASEVRMRIAAASLLVYDEHQAPMAIGLLRRALAGRLSADERLQAERALHQGLATTERWAEAAGLGRRLAGVAAPRSEVHANYLEALLRLGRHRELQAELDRRLRVRPGDEYLVGLRAEAAYQQGHATRGRGIQDESVRVNPGKPYPYNHRAWSALCVPGASLPRALEDARTAVRLSQYREASYLDTLAVVAAEAGALAEARQAIVKAQRLLGMLGPEEHLQYAHGRIAEQLGLREEAIRAYRSVPREDPREWCTTHALAQKRLKALGAPARPGGS